MTELSPEERIRRLQERRRDSSTSLSGAGRSGRRTPGIASRVAVLGASTTMVLGMMAGMAWSAELQTATTAAPSAVASTAEVSPRLAVSAEPSGVLAQTRSAVNAVPAPAIITPTRQMVSITRSGGSR